MESLVHHILTFTLALFLLVVNFLAPCLATPSTSLATDRSALLAFKSHIKLDPYKIVTTNWTGSSSVCAWIGVTCGRRRHRVVALNISGMGLVGTISPHLGNLTFLHSLDIGYNFFKGTMPREMSKLRSIPSSISNLSKLEVLDFTYNSLGGNIPEELGNLGSLRYLKIQNNNLVGAIPSSIFNISTLLGLAFTSNELDGSLPTDICLNHPFLQGIYLSHNQISGQIPTGLSNCSQLRLISLSYNLFNGKIPEEICKLQSLETLYLGYNHLSDVLPRDIGLLQNLVYFDIGGNQINGTLPVNMFNISSLQRLEALRSNLSGTLPREVGNLTMLKILVLAENSFTGEVPEEVGRLFNLVDLTLHYNSFTRSTSHPLFNMSNLEILSLAHTGLTGSLPRNFCNALPLLEEIYLGQNDITGVIPDSISNCSQLTILELSASNFNGFIPHSLGDLRLLRQLSLNENHLKIDPSSSELSFITSLTKCKFLESFLVNDNPLDGIIPPTVGNLSTSLQTFIASSCKLKGNIPPEIGNLSSLMSLGLENNDLMGSILHSEHLLTLQELNLEANNLRGSIPNGLCNLENIAYIYLGENQFYGAIPYCLGNVTSLRELYINSNMMVSSIPSTIWHLHNLLILDLSKNSLSGFIHPRISNLTATTYINLSLNKFSGHIPDTIGNLENLAELSLAHNTLQGSIPASMGSMVSLENLDLSYNNLTGTIPSTLQALCSLEKLNLSFNALKGEIPTNDCFKNLIAESFIANEALCGIAKFQVPPCNNISKHKSKRNKVHLALFVVAGVTACITVLIAFTCIFTKRYRERRKPVDRIDSLVPILPERVSYYQLLEATNQFDESNLLGTDSFGSVYRGTFRDGKVLAIKVFNLQVESASRSFDVECEVLRNIRHRNLTKVVGICSNEDFKALLFEYMPHGSLEAWLYSNNHWMDVIQRLSVMIDVALALEYLHHGYSTPIVHCDLKPSNVLIDEDMVGHVSDFKIAKLFGEGISIVHTNTLATLGYIAPEYGLDGLVSTKSDVYSYGIMLMEAFTRRRPSDEMFSGDMNLKMWVKGLLAEVPNQVIDLDLIHSTNGNVDKILHCMSHILELALKCSSESPGERIDIQEALAELQKIKTWLLA